MGLASILTWMVAQFPQIWTNFRNKSAEALSPWFLAEWLLVCLKPLLAAVIAQMPGLSYCHFYSSCLLGSIDPRTPSQTLPLQ